MNVQANVPNSGARDAFQSFELRIQPFAGHDFRVTGLHGREAISEPYRFEVWFTCVDPLDPETAIGQTASITLTTGGERLLASGVVIEFDADNPTVLGDFAFRVAIGPRFALTRLEQPNQIYGTERSLDLRDLISGKLDNSLSAGSTSGGLSLSIPHELRMVSDYPQRDHVVQLNETDFDFLSRTCEHHGVFYFFEHRAEGETIVFGDGNHAFDRAEHGTLPYRLTRGEADDASVASFKAVARPVSQRCSLRDYDDMQAGVAMLATQAVDQKGFGTVVEYGANFDTERWGGHLAQVRAEEQLAGRIVYHGSSTGTGLRPGTYFTLRSHPNAVLNGDYIVVSVAHDAGQRIATKGPYENSFEAIPFRTGFRPKRKTPRPHFPGLLDAVVDSSGDGARADIDAHGRYRIRFLFDETRSAAGKASMYVRQAVPYAGKGDTGFHLPLLKGTGVLVAFVNADPDRPVIVGAIPNSETPSVVSQTNHGMNRLRTPSGGLFEIHDGTPPSS